MVWSGGPPVRSSSRTTVTFWAISTFPPSRVLDRVDAWYGQLAAFVGRRWTRRTWRGGGRRGLSRPGGGGLAARPRRWARARPSDVSGDGVRWRAGDPLPRR